MIRLLDTVISLVALTIFSPLLLLVAVLIAWEDGFPILFRQERIGMGGKPFTIYKLRSMKKRNVVGLNVTIGNTDPRVLKIGRLIRKYKIDELPQLVNVICGQMSLVGPRPEVRRYTDLYDDEQRQVLNVRPGITDYASIEFRNENELLAKVANPEEYYINVIMPEKLRLNKVFTSKPSLSGYLKVLILTFRKIITE